MADMYNHYQNKSTLSALESRKLTFSQMLGLMAEEPLS